MLILLGFTAGKVSPLDVIPLLWYQLLLFIFTAIFIFFSINEKIIAKLDKNKIKA